MLKRVLVAYRIQYAFHGLVSSRLSEPGGCEFARTRVGHTVGLVRPWILSAAADAAAPALVAREAGSGLADAVVAPSAEAAARYLESVGHATTEDWVCYAGECGESRAHLMWAEATEHPSRSNARSELELAVRFAIARDRRPTGWAA
jgi:hypothetical protein